MPKITYPWRSLSIGYELRNPLTGDPAAALARLRAAGETLQRHLRSDFTTEFRLRWSTGDATELSDLGEATGEGWVARVLTEELNSARIAGLKPFDVRDAHLLRWRGGSAGRESGDWPGTTCKLVDNRWVNGRSFEIQAPSPDWGVTDEMLLFVSLEWPCPGPAKDAQGRVPPGNGGGNGNDNAAGDGQRNGGSKSG